MRISDCSSDVCSSDLPPRARTTSAYTSGGHDDRPGADAFSPLGHRVDDGTTGVPSRPALPPHEIPGIRHPRTAPTTGTPPPHASRSEEHTSELQSLMRISYAVFCLKKKKKTRQ